MALPLFKVIEIYDAQRPALFNKLANAPIGSQPIALDISQLGELEQRALEYIEEFIRLKQASAFPYPLFIISRSKQHAGILEVVESLEQLPQYYRKKNRPLNMKENSLMAKVELKQGKLSNINLDEFKPVAKTYARKHKTLYKKQTYLEYLESILGELRGEV